MAWKGERWLRSVRHGWLLWRCHTPIHEQAGPPKELPPRTVSFVNVFNGHDLKKAAEEQSFGIRRSTTSEDQSLWRSNNMDGYVEVRNKQSEPGYFVVDPSRPIRIYWDFFLMFLLFYIAFVTPVRIGFHAFPKEGDFLW